MFRYKYFILVVTILLLTSCSSKNSCEPGTDSFNEFLGLTANSTEKDLPEILGESSGGYYNESGTSFIYTYQSNENTPVAVAVNASTFKVETVLIEILSVGEEFNKSIAQVQQKYNLNDCQAEILGKTKDEVIALLGEGFDVKTIDNDVISLLYNAGNYKTSVDFRFFPEQDFKCSAIIVNWY